jgi:hypothetical protein
MPIISYDCRSISSKGETMFVRRTVIAASLIAVPIAFAAPALAENGPDTHVSCSPCASLPGINPTGAGPLITNVPTWESVWPGKDSGEKGPWEKFTGQLSSGLNSALGGLGGLLGGNA